jgi:hypothetical protein
MGEINVILFYYILIKNVYIFIKNINCKFYYLFIKIFIDK